MYEDLLLKMGEKNSDGGQFFTPREVIRAMVHTVNPSLGKTVYDPCCGTGGFLAVAYEQYVIDDDINGTAMRLVKGIEVTEEALSLDVIDEVCRGEGHYLGHPQTLELMNREYYYPHTADRRTRQDWEKDGSPDMRELARRRAALHHSGRLIP